MKNIKKITENVIYVGAGDRGLKKFENVYPIPMGMAYNSYIILDEKIAVMDTIDSVLSDIYFDNLTETLDGKSPDYLIVHHMEPDHCYNIKRLVQCYKDMRIVCTPKAEKMIGQFFGNMFNDRIIKVSEGDTLSLGKHNLRFIHAPMVHWPEVMYSYEENEKILFSADAFGAFGANNGNLFLSEVGLNDDLMGEYRRYYSNICGKFGLQVNNSLKKVSSLEIKYICPLHGHIIDTAFDILIDKYTKWATYTAEDDSALIIYGSMHGNTENAANYLSYVLGSMGCRNIKVYDAAVTHYSYIVSDCFKHRNIVFMSPTYNNSIYLPVRTLIDDLKHLGLQNRNISIVENGSWAFGAGKQIKEEFDACKNITYVGDIVKITSVLNEESKAALDVLAEDIAKNVKKQPVLY